MQRFDRAGLERQEQITYDILLDFYGTQAKFHQFDWPSSEGLYTISPMFGTQVQLASFMQTTHVVKKEKSARNYVAGRQAMGEKLDGLTAEMQRQSAAGVVLPPSLLEKSLVIIENTIAPAPRAVRSSRPSLSAWEKLRASMRPGRPRCARRRSRR